MKSFIQLITGGGSIRKTILTGLGEIILVVLSILIAFQIDSWKENRVERKEEILTLKEIQSNLHLDLDRLNRNLKNLEENLTAINTIRNYFDQNLPYHDSLKHSFALIIRYGHFPPNTSGYELLKSKGLETISNEQLRRDISLLYDRYYSYIHTLEEERYRYNYTTVISELQSKFHDNDIFITSIPNDFDKLKKDVEFREILNFTYSINSYVYNNDYTKTRNLVATLISDIQQELVARGKD
jgi:hypothetical protein